MTHHRGAGAPAGREHDALYAVPDRPLAHAQIAAAMTAQGHSARAADRLAAAAVAALLPLVEAIDEQEPPTDETEIGSGYTAGWHEATDSVRHILTRTAA